MGGIAAVAFTQQQNYMVEGQKKLAAHRNADEKHQRKRRGHPGTDGHQPGYYHRHGGDVAAQHGVEQYHGQQNHRCVSRRECLWKNRNKKGKQPVGHTAGL